VIRIINPQIIIFDSILSWNDFAKHKLHYFDEVTKNRLLKDSEIKIDFVPHSSCAWWNKNQKKLSLQRMALH
jgi:hypothetical protein